MEVFLGMADRKLTELKEQQIQLAETLDELEKLRQTTHQMLNKTNDVKFLYVNVNFYKSNW